MSTEDKINKWIEKEREKERLIDKEYQRKIAEHQKELEEANDMHEV